MLFTDNPPIRISDLADHETAILETASIEGINFTTKVGLARDEVGLQLQSQFPQLGLANIALNNVVITPALRLWLIFHTLEIVYRDAFHNQLNDRYKAKWDEYKDLSSLVSGLLFQIGVGTVVDPIPQADHPLLSLAPGTLAPAKYFVEVAWRNAIGEEGCPSELAELVVTDGSTLQTQPVNPPPNAVAWNTYAGVTPNNLFLQ